MWAEWGCGLARMPVFDASGGLSGAAARHLMQVVNNQRERRRRMLAGEAPVAEDTADAGRTLRVRSNWELVQRSVGHGMLCRERTCGPGRLCINCSISAGLSLFDAIRKKDLGKVDEVLAGGADCGATPMVYQPGQTALHLAAEHDFVEAVGRCHMRAPHTLEGESMSGVGTPLHAALWAGAKGAAEALLNLGASTRKFSRAGMTPIDLVVASPKYSSAGEKMDMLRLLESAGCTTSDVGRSGRTPQKTAELYLRRAQDALAKAKGMVREPGEEKKPWETVTDVGGLERAVAMADEVLLWVKIGTQGRERWKRRRLVFLLRLKGQSHGGDVVLDPVAAMARDVFCVAPDSVFQEVVRRI